MNLSIDQCMPIAAQWLTESDDLLVMSVYGAGERDYAFCSTENAIWDFHRASGEVACCSTTICLYRGHRLPLRGIVDGAFIQNAVAMAPANTPCVVVRLAPRTGHLLGGNCCDNHSEIAIELGDARGESVAFGPLPDWDPLDLRDPGDRGWIAWQNMR
jgi:hypothetical protein